MSVADHIAGIQIVVVTVLPDGVLFEMRSSVDVVWALEDGRVVRPLAAKGDRDG